jgi:hypothetical protein
MRVLCSLAPGFPMADHLSTQKGRGSCRRYHSSTQGLDDIVSNRIVLM